MYVHITQALKEDIMILKGQKRKNERGYRLKANHFSFSSRPLRRLSEVPNSRVYIKLFQTFTKMHIYTISYRNSRVKQTMLRKTATKLKKIISQRKLIVI